MVDLRSDTVTQPTPEMRRAMMDAPLGDDVLGDDPTVKALEAKVAALLGKEAACFVPSGTMANQSAIRAQTQAGDLVLAHEHSHIIMYESGAPAAISGVLIHPLRGEFGRFTPGDVHAAMRPRNDHFAPETLLVTENTHNQGGGAVWPMDQLAAVVAAARERGLRVHLDGARIWNACAALEVEPNAIARQFDTVSCCFSKGLGSPAGSAVAGDAATIARVRRFRKMLGGAMRQSGLLAAAAIHALDHHRERLRVDHERAATLAGLLGDVPGLSVRPIPQRTNMVFFDLADGSSASELCMRLERRGVRMLAAGPSTVRAVFHLDVPEDGAERTAEIIRAELRA